MCEFWTFCDDGRRAKARVDVRYVTPAEVESMRMRKYRAAVLLKDFLNSATRLRSIPEVAAVVLEGEALMLQHGRVEVTNPSLGELVAGVVLRASGVRICVPGTSDKAAVFGPHGSGSCKVDIVTCVNMDAKKGAMCHQQELDKGARDVLLDASKDAADDVHIGLDLLEHFGVSASHISTWAFFERIMFFFTSPALAYIWLGMAGPTFPVLVCLLAWHRASRTKIVFLENVPSFPISTIEALMGDLYTCYFFYLSPSDVGCEYLSRQRVFIMLLLRGAAQVAFDVVSVLETVLQRSGTLYNSFWYLLHESEKVRYREYAQQWLQQRGVLPEAAKMPVYEFPDLRHANRFGGAALEDIWCLQLVFRRGGGGGGDAWYEAQKGEHDRRMASGEEHLNKNVSEILQVADLFPDDNATNVKPTTHGSLADVSTRAEGSLVKSDDTCLLEVPPQLSSILARRLAPLPLVHLFLLLVWLETEKKLAQEVDKKEYALFQVSEATAQIQMLQKALADADERQASEQQIVPVESAEDKAPASPLDDPDSPADVAKDESAATAEIAALPEPPTDPAPSPNHPAGVPLDPMSGLVSPAPVPAAPETTLPTPDLAEKPEAKPQILATAEKPIGKSPAKAPPPKMPKSPAIKAASKKSKAADAEPLSAKRTRQGLQKSSRCCD
ncbi:unnamed protein product [Symbiodinium sp. KB8]|nr:unnamed protein product [Symbiodinium sp. KB8]